jgi:hypothetical protein
LIPIWNNDDLNNMALIELFKMKYIEQEAKCLRVRLTWAEFTLLLSPTSQISAQQPVETTLLGGRYCDEDGICNAKDFGWFNYDCLRRFRLKEIFRISRGKPYCEMVRSRQNWIKTKGENS